MFKAQHLYFPNELIITASILLILVFISVRKAFKNLSNLHVITFVKPVENSTRSLIIWCLYFHFENTFAYPE
jgi:hypothetical protein